MDKSGTIYVPTSDQVGTIWNLLDSSAAKANSYTYDAFGVGRSVSETISNLYRFAANMFDSDADLYYFILREYAPANARFRSRDPLRYHVGGTNPYLYVEGAPVSWVDLLGLFKVKRDGGPKAKCTAEEGDTIAKLATKVGLDASEWDKWLTIRGKIKTLDTWKGKEGLTPQTVLCAGQKVEVPNTVLAYWAGELGWFGKWWVGWNKDVQYLKDRGFQVAEHEAWTAATLEAYLSTATQTADLHGIYFWGHGFEREAHGRIYGGVQTKARGAGRERYSYYANWKLRYRLAMGFIFACYSFNARPLFTENAIFALRRGILVPPLLPPPAGLISFILRPGAQGTRK